MIFRKNKNKNNDSDKMNSDIQINQSLTLNNVLHIRRNLNQQSFLVLNSQIERILSESGAERVGGTLTVTHNISLENSEQIIDFELFIPLNKIISPSDEFDIIEIFTITNALKIRIVGNLQSIQEKTQILNNYINEHELKPCTPLYIYTVKDAKMPEEIDNMITDLYVGVEST